MHHPLLILSTALTLPLTLSNAFLLTPTRLSPASSTSLVKLAATRPQDILTQYALKQQQQQQPSCKDLPSNSDIATKALLGCATATSTTPQDMVDKLKVSIANAKTANERASILIQLAGHTSENAAKLVKETMKDAMAAAKVHGDELSFDNLEGTGKLVAACAIHADCIEQHFLNEELEGVTNFLLRGLEGKTTVTVDAATYAALGLLALTNHVQSLTIAPENITTAPNQLVTVSLTTLMGKPSSMKWTLSGAPAGVMVHDSSTLMLDGSKAPKTGTFTIVFEVNKAQTTRILSLPKFKLEFTKPTLAILQKTGRKDFDGVTFPSSVKGTIKAEESDVVEFSTRIMKSGGSGDVLPTLDQVMLRMHSSTTGKEHWILPSSSSSTDGEYKFTLPIASSIVNLEYMSGEYQLSLVVSDAVAEPVQWTLFTSLDVHFSRSEPEKKNLPLFKKQLLHESDNTLVMLPEIHHRFRPADRRAPGFVAMVVSGFVLMLLVVFVLYGVIYLGFLVQVIKTIVISPVAWLTAAHLALFFWYWLGPVVKAPNFVEMSLMYLPPLTLTLSVFLRRHAGSTSGEIVTEEKKKE